MSPNTLDALTTRLAVALFLMVLATTGHAEQQGISSDASPTASEDSSDSAPAEVESEQRTAPQMLAALCRPFFDQPTSRRIVRMGRVAAQLNADAQAISEWDRAAARPFEPLRLELPQTTISMIIASKLLRALRESQSTSEQRNAALSAMLLANPENDETRLLSIRALSHELARLRGEPAQALVTVAIATFAVNQAEAIERSDPRHRLGLIEALVEIRDFAGLERATRGYKGHSLQSLLDPYRRMTEFEEHQIEVPQSVAESLGMPGSTRLLVGMYRNDDGGLVWVSE